ncbi:MAG: hypothetical protein N2D54_10535, partial [Chloroflexota bacterium]
MKLSCIAPAKIPSRAANSMQTMKMAQAFTALGHRVRLFVPGEPSQKTWDELSSQYGLQHKFEIKWLS